MVACEEPFPIVVTTNSGYPLDQNLYQAVKGMSAAAQIVASDGYIATAARCNDGFPEHGNFRKLLLEHGSPRALLDTITTPGFSMYDQWEAQLMAGVLLKARVGLFSELPADEVRRAHLEPIEDLQVGAGSGARPRRAWCANGDPARRTDDHSLHLLNGHARGPGLSPPAQIAAGRGTVDSKSLRRTSRLNRRAETRLDRSPGRSYPGRDT